MPFLAENVLRAGRADDDFGTVGRRADFDAGVAVFGEFADEEFVEFGVEYAVSDEFSFRAHFGA